MRKSGFLIYYVLFCIVCFSLGLLLSFILKVRLLLLYLRNWNYNLH